MSTELLTATAIRLRLAVLLAERTGRDISEVLRLLLLTLVPVNDCSPDSWMNVDFAGAPARVRICPRDLACDLVFFSDRILASVVARLIRPDGPKVILERDGIKRTLSFPFAICASVEDAWLLIDALTAKFGPREAPTISYGWVDVHAPLPIIPDTQPRKWSDE